MPRALLAAFAFALIVARPAAALAQLDDAHIPTMTLPQALEYARAHQPMIKSALAEYAARRAEARVPRAAWLPQIGGTVQAYEATTNNSTGLYMATPEVDLPRIGGTRANTTSWSPTGSTLVAVSLSQEVYDFGRISAQIAMQDALAQLADASADAVQLDVQLGVEESYASVLAARHVLLATVEALRRATTHRDFAQAGVKSGLRPPIDLTRAQADVAQLEVRRIQTASGLEAARAGFAASMASDSLQVDAQELAPDASIGPALQEAFRQAIAHNPAVAAALARLRAQAANVSATTRELLPNLSASAGLSGRAGGAAPSTAGVAAATGDGWLPDIPNWHVGLILQWNIFDATVLARRDAAKAREDVARADLENTSMMVNLGTERAWLTLDAALKALPGLQATVDAAIANNAQADARFRAGLGNIIELADSESLLTNAQLEFAVGQFSVARARSELGRVLGQSVLPLVTKTGKGQ
jgi:outer membrane protein